MALVSIAFYASAVSANPSVVPDITDRYRGLTKPAAPLGSPIAARFLAAKYVGMSQRTHPVRVNDAPIIEGNRATAKAVFGNGAECTVRMVRVESEKEYGWMVEAIACDSAS